MECIFSIRAQSYESTLCDLSLRDLSLRWVLEIGNKYAQVSMKTLKRDEHRYGCRFVIASAKQCNVFLLLITACFIIS